MALGPCWQRRITLQWEKIKIHWSLVGVERRMKRVNKRKIGGKRWICSKYIVKNSQRIHKTIVIKWTILPQFNGFGSRQSLRVPSENSLMPPSPWILTALCYSQDREYWRKNTLQMSQPRVMANKKWSPIIMFHNISLLTIP